MADRTSDAPSPGELVRAALERHGPTLQRITASYARSKAEKDDLMQEIAIALLAALPTFRGESSERTFVFRVAHNRAVTFLARRGRHTDDIDDHVDSVAATSGKNPMVRYERKEREHRLLAAVRALPLRDRQLMTLLLEGMSQREIADVMGITENNVAVRANRARTTLRIFLEEESAS